MTKLVMLVLRCFFFNSIFEGIDEQITKIKTTVNNSFSQSYHSNPSLFESYPKYLPLFEKKKKKRLGKYLSKIDDWWCSLMNCDLKPCPL